MSDATVSEALRSTVKRVVVEAPAGTGKTYQAACYARHATTTLQKGQKVLILAHTHAACNVFASRTRDLHGRIQIGTIDSLIAMIAKAYYKALDLPADIHAWSMEYGQDCYAELARRVRSLLCCSPTVSSALVERYPIVICDEHQDASADQHQMTEALERSGARMRYFGDLMQAIFTAGQERVAQQRRWQDLIRSADLYESLDTAHRWRNGSPELGAWILEQRMRLRAGDPVDLLAQLPRGLRLLRADNQAPRYGGYQLSSDDARPIRALIRNNPTLLVLTPHNATVQGIHGFFGWRIPIWEGHTREALTSLLTACRRNIGNAALLGRAVCSFLMAIGKGFAATDFGNCFMEELNTGCTRQRRGKPAEIQSVARLILQEPNHIGVGAALNRIHQLMQASANFQRNRIDLRREFGEARQIQGYPDISTVLARQSHQRGSQQEDMPAQAISTIHKSKGLETSHALLLPCESNNLADNEKNRCLLYVALSRASESLTLVIPRANPSPLFRL